MKQVIKKSILQLNEILSKEKKLEVKDTTPLISEQSNLESIDLVNLFVNLEKNLKEKGADLIVTNQSHIYWKNALKINSFISGPSNFIFASSVSLA